MKLSELSNSYLTYMIKEYSKKHNRIFGWESLRNVYPNEDIEFICDAFRKLQIDGLVKIFWLDNVPDSVELQIDAIIQAEENTILRKTYKILKEIRDWF